MTGTLGKLADDLKAAHDAEQAANAGADDSTYDWVDSLADCEDPHPPNDCRDGCPYSLPETVRARAIAKFGIVALRDVTPTPPAPLELGRIDTEGHTVVYGDGGVGKGTLASDWIGQIAQSGGRVLILDYEDHQSEWNRRIDGFGYDRANIHHVAPLGAAWGGTRGPVWEQANDICELIEVFGYTHVVIDSAAVACAGHDPSKPEAVTRYAGAIQRFGIPVLSLAHVTKQIDLSHPFGSVFWHNLARVTWSMEAKGTRVILKNRKHNNGPKGATFIVEVLWRPDGSPMNLNERPWHEAWADRIIRVLTEHGAKSSPQITAILNVDVEDEDDKASEDVIRRTLTRDQKRQENRRTFQKSGDLWQLRSSSETPAFRVLPSTQATQATLLSDEAL